MLIRLLDMTERTALDNSPWQRRIGTATSVTFAPYRRHRLNRWIGGGWAVLGVGTFLRDEFLQPTDEQRWRVINMIPHLSLAWWLFGFAVIFAVGIFEASFRLSGALYAEIASLTDNRKNLRVNWLGFAEKVSC